MTRHNQTVTYSASKVKVTVHYKCYSSNIVGHYCGCLSIQILEACPSCPVGIHFIFSHDSQRNWLLPVFYADQQSQADPARRVEFWRSQSSLSSFPLSFGHLQFGNALGVRTTLVVMYCRTSTFSD